MFKMARVWGYFIKLTAAELVDWSTSVIVDKPVGPSPWAATDIICCLGTCIQNAEQLKAQLYKESKSEKYKGGKGGKGVAVQEKKDP